MTYSVVAEADGDNAASGTTISTSGTITVSDHDTVVVFLSTGSSDISTLSAASDGTNTYTRRGGYFSGTVNTNLSILVAEDVAAGTYTVTGSWGGGSQLYRVIKAIAISGLKAASFQTGSYVTGDQASPGTGTDGVTTASATPTEQPACLIGFAVDNDVQTLTAGTGFTGLTAYGALGTGTPLFKPQHKRLTSTSAVAATWTSTPVNSPSMSAAIILSEAAGATLSAPTVIAGTTSATIGATTDEASGTFYVVVDTSANLSGVTATEIKAGQKAGGAAALASGNSSVTDTSPDVGVTGLSQYTTYAYAMVQNTTDGDSNVLTGTFTTGLPVAWFRA